MTKTALVTGGNKGIGFEICRQLAAKGFQVFLAARDRNKGEAACDVLKKEGLNVEFIALDVSSEASISQAADELKKRITKLDALVNNAGIFLDKEGDGLNVKTDALIDTFKTNTLGPLFLARALLPLLEQAKGAQIVNMSSGMGQLYDMRDGSISYRLSKTALNAVTRILSSELSDKKIAVNSMCPGWVKTEMGGKGATRTPTEGADTATWLASGEAKNATGGFYRDRKSIPW